MMRRVNTKPIAPSIPPTYLAVEGGIDWEAEGVEVEVCVVMTAEVMRDVITEERTLMMEEIGGVCGVDNTGVTESVNEVGRYGDIWVAGECNEVCEAVPDITPEPAESIEVCIRFDDGMTERVDKTLVASLSEL
jgi:hypothetical protein